MFDILGRVTEHKHTTDGNHYTTAYAYNLSGALSEQTYPSGRVVKNVLDGNGGLETVKSKKNSSFGFHDYAKNFTYNAAGAVTSMQLGNGRWESTVFNSRLQPTQIALGVTPTATNLLKLEYGYGTSTTNNGNLLEQKITVPNVGATTGFTAIQAYTYDSLNRLASATETISSTQTWKQTFQYDRYGNRRFNTESNNTTTLPESFDPDVFNPTLSANNNRFATGQGYSYDANGNVTTDAAGKQFFYDAENRQKEVKDSGNNSLGQYSYDGDGRRVKKTAGDEVTIFVHNASGLLVAEYSTQIETTNAQVSYLTTDHLGSPRVITDENGAVTSRKDFAPFGEETVTTQRSTALGYNAPNVRQDFTGYENDEESGIQFAQARYFSSGHGRFTSVDPLTASADLRNPQTFNRYVYALNNPYRFVDPLGLAAECVDGSSNTECGASGENDPVTVALNIVYDKAQYSLEAAKSAVAATIADLQSTFSAINVLFSVTFTAGTADVAPRDNNECANCAYNITSGAVDGAINAFLHSNPAPQPGASQANPISQFIPENAQIFLESVPGKSFGGKLAVEVGHLFRFFVNGNPRSGIMTTADNNAGGIVDRADITETQAVHAANNAMRSGGLAYGRDYVDDYRSVSNSMVTPGRTANILGDLAPRNIVPRQPTSFDIYRLGARRVAAQRR